MKRTQLIIITIVTLMAGNFSLQAKSIDDFYPGIPQEKLETLKNTGELTRYFFGREKPLYTPGSPFRDQLNETIERIALNIGVESIFFYKTNTPPSPLKIYNKLLSISTMKGIEYYSKSRKRMRTLYTQSNIIKDKDNPLILPDPVVSSIPLSMSLTIKQTDLTFGENIYKTTLQSSGDSVWIQLVNTTPMKYKFIKMVNPCSLSMNLVVTRVDEGIIFYGVTGVKAFSFLGLERTKKESFYNRMKAIYTWFAKDF